MWGRRLKAVSRTGGQADRRTVPPRITTPYSRTARLVAILLSSILADVSLVDVESVYEWIAVVGMQQE